MVTTTPNDLVRPVHTERMPVLLSPEEYDRWLTGAPEHAVELLQPFPAEGMRIVHAAEGATADEGGLVTG